MNKMILSLVIAGGLPLGIITVCAEDAAVPSANFNAAHYETLWTKSPFSVATAEAVEESPDYSVVGVTQLDGVSYASIIEKQNQDHFLISSDKPYKGLLLKTITRSHDGKDTYATVEKDGQILTLKLESAAVSATVPGMPPVTVPGVPPQPGQTVQNITFPGANNPPPTSYNPASTPPRTFTRIHRPPIHLPPNPTANQPDQGAQPAAAPTGGAPANAAPGGAPPAEPVQPHTPPPSP